MKLFKKFVTNYKSYKSIHKYHILNILAKQKVTYKGSKTRGIGEHFSSEWVFPYFVQSARGILVKRVRKLYRQVAHDLIIVHLQLTYFHKYCIVLKLPNV